MSFFDRNKDNLDEDAGAREQAGELHSQYDGRKRLSNFAEIALDRIEADPQHREHFDADELANLAKSLQKHGQKQAINVRWDEDRQKYIIIAGERRFRAAQIAELGSVQCNIAPDDITKEEILVAQIIENALRKDLLPSEKAKAYRDLMQRQKLTASQLAEEIHVNKSTISRTLGLLSCSEELQKQVDEGHLSIKDAITKSKATASLPTAPAAKKSKSKRTKEVKLSVDGFTISIKARRLLTDELVVEALRKAIDKLEPAELRRAA